jgi:hypothetical protein
VTRGELDVLAAKIWIAHQDQVKPAQPRRERQLMGELIAELIVNGGHDPADVEAALTRWRDRRARGDRVGRTTLPYILEDIELGRARAADGRVSVADLLEYATELARAEVVQPREIGP